MDCRTCLISILLLTSVITMTGLEILVPPESQTVLLDSFARFNCTATGGRTIWIINGTEYVSNTDEPHRANGIVRIRYQVGSNQIFTVLRVNASLRNNNTAIKCRVSNVESDPVFLRVQGVLGAPGDLTAISINITTIHITWLPPFTLDINIGPDILGYSVMIRDSTTQELLNLTGNEYYYGIPSCHSAMPQVRVAGWNGIGIGEYSDPVGIHHHVTQMLSSPSMSIGASSLFSCKVLCDHSLLLTWLINETLLGHVGSAVNFTTSNNYFHQCSHDGMMDSTNMYTEFLEMMIPEEFSSFTVQCFGLCLCRESDMVPNCTTRTHYSLPIEVSIRTNKTKDKETRDTTKDYSTDIITTEANPETLLETPLFTTGVVITAPPATLDISISILGSAVGTTASMTAFLLVLIIILSGFICCRILKNKSKEAITEKDTSKEVIYEQCGGAQIMMTKDVPALPPHPKIKPCPAYAVTRPTEPCDAAYTIAH